MTRNEISIRAGGTFMPTNLEQAIEVAKMIAHSGMVPKAYQSNTGAVLVAIQMGAEVGLSPMAAIQNIAVINGRPSLWGDGMLAVVTGHPDCEYVDEQIEGEGDAMVATCVVKRRGRPPVVRDFSVDDAKVAGLWKKPGPWVQYPKRMLQMRARGFALRDAFPDALRGIQSAEETRDVVDQEFVEAQSQPLATGRHSVRAPKPGQPEPETPRETPPDRPGSSQIDPRPSQPATPPEMDQIETGGEIKDSDRGIDAPESDDEPTMITQPRPPEQQPMFELNAGESELLGMVGRAETMAEIDVLVAESGKRRLRKKAKMMIVDAIKRKRAELQRRGKAEPGADG